MKMLPLLVTAFVLFLPSVAWSVLITNVTTGTIAFNDNFESGSFSPSVGSWVVSPMSTVTNSTTPPNPGPFQGSYYAQLFRDSAGEGALSAILSNSQITIGQHIRLEMMVYLPSATDVNARGQFYFTEDATHNTARAWVRPDGLGNVIAVGPGLTLTDTGLNYITDVWQRWQLDYIIGASTFNFSLDGQQVTGLASYSSGGVSSASLFNGSNVPGSLYLDSIPEPSTAFLGAIGMMVLFFQQTRRIRNSHS